MIKLVAFRILKKPIGNYKKLYIQMAERVTWKNDFNEFNIFSPTAWRNYLANDFRLSTGKRLPDKTPDGDYIGYAVFMSGMSKEAITFFNQTGGVNLFPGYEEGKKKRKVEEFGRIR